MNVPHASSPRCQVPHVSKSVTRPGMEDVLGCKSVAVAVATGVGVEVGHSVGIKTTTPAGLVGLASGSGTDVDSASVPSGESSLVEVGKRACADRLHAGSLQQLHCGFTVRRSSAVCLAVLLLRPSPTSSPDPACPVRPFSYHAPPRPGEVKRGRAYRRHDCRTGRQQRLYRGRTQAVKTR